MPKILVKNTEPRLHRIGISATEQLQLSPGVNEVDADAWEQAKRVALCQGRVDSGVFVELSKPSKDGEDPIAGLSAGAALKLVGDTYDRELLRGWLAREKRPAVAQACADQIKLIDEAGGPTQAKAESEAAAE